MKFQRELTHEVMKEAMPLLILHWEEIAKYKDISLEPDFGLYETAEKQGQLRTYTVRTEDNELVGYACYFIRSNMHYKSSIQAVQDVIFIHPKHRGSGGRFIKWCDEQLAIAGAQAVYHHVKAAHNFGPLLERMGYELVDLIYTRRLS